MAIACAVSTSPQLTHPVSPVPCAFSGTFFASFNRGSSFFKTSAFCSSRISVPACRSFTKAVWKLERAAWEPFYSFCHQEKSNHMIFNKYFIKEKKTIKSLLFSFLWNVSLEEC